jgi:hypothetical protein
MLALSIASVFSTEAISHRKLYPGSADGRLIEVMKMRATTVLAIVLLAAGVAARGQAPAPGPCSDPTKSVADCPTAPAAPSQTKEPAKSTAQRFPFPGEEPSSADKPADAVPNAPAPDAPAPDAPTPGQAKKPHAPLPDYPGDPDAPPPSSSSSSSSSSGNAYNPGDDPGPLADAGSSGDNTKAPSRRKKLPKVNPETPESRAANDLTVAEFYQNDGNFLGAYTRAKDAVEYQPADPNTHFALAEAARKLGKVEEAKQEYAEVLKLDPIPKQLKASQRALAELGARP